VTAAGDGTVEGHRARSLHERRQALRVAAENIPGVKAIEEHLSFSLPT
jgi:hypothetical protein